jgi:hypothetical protein
VASQAPVPPAAGSVSTIDEASIQPRARLAGPDERPAGHCARAPSSASAPQVGAPAPAAAARRLYKVPSPAPDARVAALYRYPRDVWEAIESYDVWLHGATLRDVDTPSDSLGPHPSDPQEEELTPEEEAAIDA